MELDHAVDLTLLEAGDRLGGVLQTETDDGYCVELGPDSMLTQVSWGIDLCRRIGFEEQLLGTNDAHRQTYIVRRGKLLRLPEGLAIMAPSRIWPTIRSPVLSIPGKVRLACEYFVPQRRESADESLAAFARRRFGRETFERLVQPLVSGIYMADPEKLSMQAALPRFRAMEARHGSLIRAARRAARENTAQEAAGGASGPRYSMFVAPRDGFGSLVMNLAERLPLGVVHLRSPVDRIDRREDGRWRLTVSGSAIESAAQSRPESFDAVIVTAPAFQAAQLLRHVDESLSSDLAAIEHAGCIVVIASYARDQVEHPLDGFGFVVPQVERRDLIACTFSSVKYAHRAPPGEVLVRVFLGGANRPDIMQKDDHELQEIVARELSDLLGISGEARFTRIARWPGIMPQYHVGHLSLIDRVDTAVAALAGLELAGNSYRGVGIPHCIHSGEQAAERVVAALDDD
jgi:oxygen-dependent protoporphyrinogen oxidase